ncbi:retrovirus-related pol polyprotein from transposon TNT 1-94 [Tanacetum coccineum]
MWVYKTKYNQDGSVECLKARLVVKGSDKKECTYYKQTFSIVVNSASLSVFITLATANGWPLHQLDVNNAFLHGYVEEFIYMKPPNGYIKLFLGKFTNVGEVLPTTIVYGEDILLTGNSVKDIHATNLALDKKFTIKDLGKYILDLLKDARLIAEKAASSPLPQNLKISLDKGDALTSSGIMIKALGHNQHSFLIDRLGFTSAPT